MKYIGLLSAGLVAIYFPAAAFELEEVEEPISVTGEVFTHFMYDLTEGADGYYEFELGRARLNFNGKVTEDVGYEARVEVQREYSYTYDPLIGVVATPGRYTLHVRHAFMDVGGLVPNHHIYAGMIATPWNNYENTIWGWRMLRRVAVTEQGYANVADLGVGFGGSFLGGKLDHHVTFTNGGGYTNIETAKGKDIDYRFSIFPFSAHTVFGGFSANVLFRYGNIGDDPRSEELVYGALGGLKHDFINFGVGYFRQTTGPGGAEVNENLITSYAWVKLPNHLHVVGRFDMVDPNGDVENDGWNDILFGFGLDFAGGHCRVMPNFRTVMYQSDELTDNRAFYLNGEINTF